MTPRSTVLHLRVTALWSADQGPLEVFLQSFYGSAVVGGSASRTRSRQTLIRSPHVFAKSKENFGVVSWTKAYAIDLGPLPLAVAGLGPTLAALHQLFPQRERRWKLTRS